MQARSISAALLSAFACAMLAATPASAQESKSAPLAKELAQLLESSKLTNIGASDPTNGAFVAAMYIPGTTTLNSAATGNTAGGGLSSLVQWGMVTGFFYAAVDA